MYVRVKKFDRKKSSVEYLQIVESIRKGNDVRQKFLYSLGRMDQLKKRGQIDRLIQSLSRFSEKLKVEAVAPQKATLYTQK